MRTESIIPRHQLPRRTRRSVHHQHSQRPDRLPASLPMMRGLLLLLVVLLFLGSGPVALAESTTSVSTIDETSSGASIAAVGDHLGQPEKGVPDVIRRDSSSSFSSSSSDSDDGDIHSNDEVDEESNDNDDEEEDEEENDQEESKIANGGGASGRGGQGSVKKPVVVEDGSGRDPIEAVADVNLGNGPGRQWVDAETSQQPPVPLPLDCTAVLREQAAVCEQSSQALRRDWNEQLSAAERQHVVALETCVTDRQASEAKLLAQRQKSVRLLQERIQALQLHTEKLQLQLERTKQDLFDARRENHLLTEQVAEWHEAWWNVPEQYRKVTMFVESYWQYVEAKLQRGWRVVEPYWTVVENALRAACNAASRFWNDSVAPRWRQSVQPQLIRLGRWMAHYAREAWIEGRLLVHVCGVHLRSGATKAYEATHPHRAKLWLSLQPHSDAVVARFGAGYQSVVQAMSAAVIVAEDSAAGRAFRGAEHACRTKIAVAADAVLRRYSNGTDVPSSSSSAVASAWAVTVLQGLQRAAQPVHEGGVPGEWVLLVFTLWLLLAVPRTLRWLTSPRQMRKENTAPPSWAATNGAAVANGSSTAAHGSNGSSADQSNGSTEGHQHPQRRNLI